MSERSIEMKAGVRVARSLVLAFALAASCGAALADAWKNIGESDWIGGARLKSQASLAGKVVLVDVWGKDCPPCRALLPRLAQTWESFRDKPFVVIGSHRQARDDAAVKALISENGVTYPVYQGAGLVNGEPSSGGSIPFLYVVNQRGKVIYSGRSLPEATEAAVNAFETVGDPKTLEETKEEIEYLKEVSPKEAVRLIKKMRGKWPKEAEAYKDGFAALVAAAREQVAAEKAAEKEKAAQARAVRGHKGAGRKAK